MRLIDADALTNRHCAENCGCTREECGFTYDEDGCDSCLFVTEIENVPIVDAEPVRHGRWIYGITLNHEWRKCSECLVSQDIFG